MGFMIVVAPFWSAFTEAWAKQDVAWIESIMKKLMKLWLVIVAGGYYYAFVFPVSFLKFGSGITLLCPYQFPSFH